MDENSVVLKYLAKEGYNVDTKYYQNVSIWKEWYDGTVSEFHKYHDQNNIERELYKLGMAKKGCEDWSSILFTERDNIIANSKDNQEYLDKMLENLGFYDKIPDNIENAFWSSTIATVARVKDAIVDKKKKVLLANENTRMELIDVTAKQIVPLKIEHGKIVDLAIVSTIKEDNKEIYYIEIHELINNEYIVRNVYLDSNGAEVEREGILKEYNTHSNIPLFSLLSPKIVNNKRYNNGLGLCIYANAIDQLKSCDIAYNNYVTDGVLGGKKVFYNRKLVKYETVKRKDENGEEYVEEIPIYPDDLTKQQFQVLSNEAETINDKALIQEHNPDLRMDDNEKNINLALNLYSFKIGLGKGYYKFENGTVVTATQYLGENRDLVSNAKKHRKALNSYVVGVARSILLLGRLLFGENVDEKDDINLTDKDGFLVSDEELQEQYRQDFNAGLMSKLTYLIKARGMSEKEAREELERIKSENPSVKDLVGE